MQDDRRRDLARYRYAKAEEMLRDAELLLEEERYSSSNNRAYYAVFNAMRAVLALDAVEFKKHSGNIQYFLREYVKTGIFDKDISEIIISASRARNNSDYDDFYVPSADEAQQQIANAKRFLTCVGAYLETAQLNDEQASAASGGDTQGASTAREEI